MTLSRPGQVSLFLFSAFFQKKWDFPHSGGDLPAFGNEICFAVLAPHVKAPPHIVLDLSALQNRLQALELQGEIRVVAQKQGTAAIEVQAQYRRVLQMDGVHRLHHVFFRQGRHELLQGLLLQLQLRFQLDAGISVAFLQKWLLNYSSHS